VARFLIIVLDLKVLLRLEMPLKDLIIEDNKVVGVKVLYFQREKKKDKLV